MFYLFFLRRSLSVITQGRDSNDMIVWRCSICLQPTLLLKSRNDKNEQIEK